MRAENGEVIHLCYISLATTSLPEDDLGVEGVVVLPDSDVKKVRIGSKQASETIRRETHDSAQSANEAHAAQREKLELQTNEQAPWGPTKHVFIVITYLSLELGPGIWYDQQAEQNWEIDSD